MGSLLSRGVQKPLETDCIGVAVAQYFRLLKAMTKIMIGCFCLSIPSLIIFASGKGYDRDWPTMNIFEQSSMFTMGNLGESIDMCKQINLRVTGKFELICAPGSKLEKFDDFGFYPNDHEDND